MSCLMALLCGCSLFSSEDKTLDPFLDLYLSASSSSSGVCFQPADDKLYSFSASSLPFVQFCQIFSDSTGKGIVFDSSLDKETVSFEFKNATPDEIMQLISRRFGKELLFYGNTFFLGTLKKEDRGYFIHRVRGYDVSEINAFCNSMISEFGKVNVSSDGLLFVSDRASVILQLRSMIDQLEKSSCDAWIVQFFLVLEKKDFRLDYGAEVTTSGDLSFLLTKGEGAKTDFSNVGQSLNLIFNSQSNMSRVLASPMLLCRDGSESRWSDGLRIPIPKKSVSDQGTVTTTGFDYQDTGLQLSLSVRETLTGALLKYKLIDSSVTGYVEYQPILRSSELEGACPVVSGKVYLIGELMRTESTDSSSKVLSFMTDDSKTRMQVFCRLYKISVPSVDFKTEVLKISSFSEK